MSWKWVIIIHLFFLGVITAWGQESRVLMNQEEMDAFAEQINEYVEAGDYVAAVVMYEANRDIVNPKMLCRSDRQWWKETVAELEEKGAVFNRNKEVVEQAVALYEGHEYRRCWEMLRDFRCDTGTLYREYIGRLAALRDSVEVRREKMKQMDAHVGEYINEYREGRYERLYALVGEEHLLGYVATEKVEEMRQIIERMREIIESEPERIVMSGTPLSERQLKEICRGDVSKLELIMRLDVIHYYNMLFDTEGQVERYKRSEEYGTKVEELKRKRDEALRTLYCQAERVNMGRYDAEEGCFHVLIGANKGVNLTYFNYKTADPPRAFGKRFEKVVHEALTIKRVTPPSTYWNGDKYEEYFLRIPLEEEDARRFEGMECRLVICFKPAGLREYRITGTECQSANRAYDVFEVTESLPYSTMCRVVVYSMDGEVVYDEVVGI